MSLSKNSRHLSRQIITQYALSLILFPVIAYILFLLFVNLYSYYRGLTNDESSVLFWTAQILRETLPIWVGLLGIGGWLILTLHFIGKPMRYLDEVVAAAESLSAPTETPLTLSPDLATIQDSLNLLREQALRNAILAKEAEQRKNDLVVYLAHDLKTPLTSIIGYLSLLADEPQISAELRARYTGIALTKAQRLEDLINEFFDITRFNLTSFTLEQSKIDFSCMLEQTVSEFLPVFSEKNLTWNTDIEPDVALLCDSDKLARVFDNLIRNAVSYSYPGTEVSLSMNTIDSGKQVMVAVSNHGKTIPQDKLSRIFDQFFRLDSSRGTRSGGSGLGLAIAREIVERHGGSITAESEQECVTFTVKLPLAPSVLS